MKYFLTTLILSLFALSPLLPTSVVFADPTSGTGAFPTSGTANNSLTSGTSNSTSGLKNPLQVSTMQDLMTAILGFVVKIGIIIVVLMIVYTGFKFVLSKGKPEEIQKARMMLLWTIVGALIILGAQAISVGVTATVNSISAGTNQSAGQGQSTTQNQPAVRIQSIQTQQI